MGFKFCWRLQAEKQISAQQWHYGEGWTVSRF